MGKPHEELLLRHGLNSLSSSWDCHLLIFLFKLTNNKIDCSAMLHKINFKSGFKGR